jgi:hypothetical protein
MSEIRDQIINGTKIVLIWLKNREMNNFVNILPNFCAKEKIMKKLMNSGQWSAVSGQLSRLTVTILILIVSFVSCQPAFGIIEDIAVPERFIANGSLTTFNFTFRLVNQSDLIATLRTDSSGADEALTLNVDYTLSATNNDFRSGGTLTTTTAAASGKTLVLERDMSRTQGVNLRQGQSLPAESTEVTLDKMMMSIQDIDKDIIFIPGFPHGDPVTSLGNWPNIEDRKGLAAAFDSTTGAPTAIAMLPTSSVAISSFMETVLDDPTARAAMATLIGQSVVGNIETYGAVADDGLDDTAAIQAALDDNLQDIFIPEGTYLCNVSVDGAVNIRGTGPKSILKAFTTDPVITITASLTGNLMGRRFFNFRIEGNSKTSKGVFYSGFAPLSEDDFDTVLFTNCSRGLDFGTVGAIGNSVRYCNFTVCDYGIYAKNSGSHGINLNSFETNRFTTIALCAIYIDGSSISLSGNEFKSNWFEGIAGFGIILKGKNFLGRPNRLVGGWFENVATSANVTLDDEGSTAAQTIWLDSTNFTSSGALFPGDSLINDSIVRIDYLDGFSTAADRAMLSVTGTSRVIIKEAMFDSLGGSSLTGNSTSEFVIEKPRQFRNTGAGNRGFIVECLPMINNVGGHTNQQPTSTLIPVNGATMTAQDGQLFGSGIQRIAVTLAGDQRVRSAVLTTQDNKSYAFSFSIRSSTTTAEDDVVFNIAGTNELIASSTLLARGDRWTHYVGVVYAGTTAPTTQRMDFKSSGSSTFDISRLQFIEFDTLEGAEAFVHNQSFAYAPLGTEAITTTVEISSAEILALNATPKTLAAAPGADRLIEFISAVLIMDSTATAYDGVAAGEDLVIEYEDGDDVSKEIETTGFIDQTNDEVRFVDSVLPSADPVPAGDDLNDNINDSIRLFLKSDEIATGTGTMSVKITYRIHTLGL